MTGKQEVKAISELMRIQCDEMISAIEMIKVNPYGAVIDHAKATCKGGLSKVKTLFYMMDDARGRWIEEDPKSYDASSNREKFGEVDIENDYLPRADMADLFEEANQ